jgi:hypothetical protein
LFAFIGDAAVLVPLLLIGFVAGFLTAGVRPLLFRTQCVAARAAFRRPNQLIPRFEFLGQDANRTAQTFVSQGF